MNGGHALVVDDEPLARERIRALLLACSRAWRVTECASGAEAIRLLRAGGPAADADIVFLDVQMPDHDGFAVLREVGAALLPPVVFVTAYDQHAVRAFDVGAVDYLLKPVDRRRFRTALDRVLARAAAGGGAVTGRELAARLASPAPPAHEPQRRFLVKTGERAVVVRAAAIDWIGTAGNYVELHVGKQSHLLRETLSTLERRLDPGQFQRIHRRSIVNLEAVEEAARTPGGWDLRLRTGARLPIGRALQQRVLAWLAGLR
jgi:two-component system, LytTR family, response regulator